MSFADDLKAEKESETPSLDVPIKLNDTVYTLRFWQMDGLEWADHTDRAPARPGVLLDMRYGYNLRALVPPVAVKSGRLVDGDDLVELDEEQWRAIFKGIGSNFTRIGDAIFFLNEQQPDEVVERLKKAFEDASKAIYG